MATLTVSQLIHEHPANDTVQETDMTSQSNKSWANEFMPIQKLRVHTQVNPDGETVTANFDDVFMHPSDDDTIRLQEAAYPANRRHYRLYSEQDGIDWFHSEVTNIVLPAFARYPVLTQTSHDPSKVGPVSQSQIVDVAYTTEYQNQRAHVAIGEFKRNILVAHLWQTGLLDATQEKFSRELRGYAYKYGCPQVFCFDHAIFLMLQFRVSKLEDIRTNCDVDCWVFPHDNRGGTPIRYAFYRFLVQGFRRFQGMWRYNLPLNNVYADRVTFFSGKPVWKTSDGHKTSTPFNCTRRVDPMTGAVYWVDEMGNELFDSQGNRLWDTGPFWAV